MFLPFRLNTPLKRQPAIRRSLEDEWLYAADLPEVCEGDQLDRLLAGTAEAGWASRRGERWIQFGKTAYMPPGNWFSGAFGSEAACCGSLLARHPARDKEGAEAIRYRLIKAGEEGEKAYEEACAALHREWAGRLRKGRSLPDLDLRYFGR